MMFLVQLVTRITWLTRLSTCNQYNVLTHMRAHDHNHVLIVLMVWRVQLLGSLVVYRAVRDMNACSLLSGGCSWG